MDPDSILLYVALVFGFYMAWNIGANDVGNSMGTSVGSRALTLRQAVVLAAIANFAGAVLVGGKVTDTVRKGITDPLIYADNPETLLYGMLAALLAAGLLAANRNIIRLACQHHAFNSGSCRRFWRNRRMSGFN